MAVVTFDTHKFIKKLEAAGVSSQQAEAFSEAVRDAQDAAEVATKADLREMEFRLEKRFAEMNERFAKADGRTILLQWMLGLVIAGIASLVLKTFF